MSNIFEHKEYQKTYIFITKMYTFKTEKDLLSLKKKLKKMYMKFKKNRPRTQRTHFINPHKCIERTYRETKLFEKKVQELKSKHLLKYYTIDPLFQMIYKNKI